MLGRLVAISLAIITVTLLITRSVDAKIITDDHDNILDGYEKLMFKDTRDYNEKIVHTNDIGPVGVADEYTNNTAAEIESKYQDLQEIYHTINEEFNTTNSTAKITELKLDYIQTINELNKLTYIEPERDYLAELSKLDAQVVALEELQYSNYTESRQILNSETIGFRAKDSNGNVGFVTAGHVVQYLTFTNTIMHQPHTSNSIIGTIPSNGDDACSTYHGVNKRETTRSSKICDFAFVKLARGVSINDDIYKSLNRVYSINDLAVLSDHTLGKMVKVAGSNSGITTGVISSVRASYHDVQLSLQSPLLSGDSGGPIFKPSTSARSTSSAEVYGILTQFRDIRGELIALYEPTDKIMTELNLRPYH